MNRLPGALWRLLALASAALLTSVLPAAWPGGVDVVLLVVVAAALTGGPGAGAFTGLAAGWVVDLVPPGAEPLGASALVYLAVGAVVGGLRRHARWSPALPLLAAFAAAAALQGVRLVAVAAGTGTATAPEALWTVGLTVLAAVLLLPLLLAVERALSRRGWA